MRYKAGAMGYSLNQRGLHAGIVRDPQDRRVKINEGEIERCVSSFALLNKIFDRSRRCIRN